MTLSNAIGVVILLLPFAAMLYWVVREAGLKETLVILAIVAAIFGCVGLGMALVQGKIAL